jgi:replicative DNA helicase
MASTQSPVTKVPPHNVEAEQSVLGGIMLDNEALNKVLEILVPDDFYRESHKKIFEVILDLFERDEPADMITVSDLLRSRNQLDSIGGIDYLSQLVDQVPTVANIVYYARIVKEKSVLRRLIAKGVQILQTCYDGPENVEDFLDHVEREIFEVAEDRVRKSYFPIKEVIKASFETIDQLYKKKTLITGIPSGFMDLDTITAGFQPSDLVVVAARPSMGKTAFCLDIARHAAVEAKVPVALFSLEMSKEQIAFRLLCAQAKVDGSKLRRGFLKQTDWPKLTTAAGILSESPIYVDDTPDLSVLEMRAKSRRLKAERDIGLIIVDYLQLMRGRYGVERREQEISEISRALKALAKELDVPVIALSQLNRRVEERGDKRPQLSDLRESGAIEQDADVIIFIYRDDVYNRNPDNPKKGLAEIIVGKQRNGPTGKVTLTFLEPYATFEDYTPRADPMVEAY